MTNSVMDIMDMRADEYELMELVLADVQRYNDAIISKNNRNVVLVFPSLSTRNRLLVHGIVQQFFYGLNTISLGCSTSFGGRVVVHHSSIESKFCEIKGFEKHTENYFNKRKARELISQSLMPKKLDPSLRSTQHIQFKRPDIPIYIPKALRDFDASDTSSTNMSSDSKQMKGSISLYSREQPNNSLVASLDLFKCIDLSSDMLIDDNELKTHNDNSGPLASTILPGSVKNINECCSNSFETNKTIKINDPNLEHVELLDDYHIIETPKNLTDCQIADIIDKITPDHVPVTQQTIQSMDLKVDDDISDMSNKQLYEKLKENVVIDFSVHDIELQLEYDANCPHYNFEDSFTSGSLSDKDENCVNEELIVQQNHVLINKSLEILETDENKKILDVDECNCEDILYNQEDIYMDPLFMEELLSTMGNVQVKCTKEDYCNYQTIEERSSDGECVIEVYGFFSDLKTIDLYNQFANFSNKSFKIVWVDDTHALAVFKSPTDRALNIRLALVKTRPLKNATKESKIRAAKVIPLSATRPKTCTASVRRLVSNALGLRVDVSPDRLNAERTLLADAKKKKIHDAQQKHSKRNIKQ